LSGQTNVDAPRAIRGAVHDRLNSVTNSSGRIYGFGIVGCGVIANLHAAALAKIENASLVAAMDFRVDRVQAFSGRFPCDIEPDLDALLGRDDVDVVCVCVPSGLHAEIGIRAAAAGKHIVIEKPIDVSLAAADALIESARSAGVTMTVIAQHRFDAGVLELRSLIEAGEIGRPILGDARIKWYRSQSYYDSGDWRGTWTYDGGGALINQGVHYTDLLRWCMGPVTEVTAVCATQNHDIDVEDVAIALLRFSSGAVGSLEATTSAYPGFRERLEITGTKGTVVVEDGVIIVRELIGDSPEAGAYGRRVAEDATPPSSAAADPKNIGSAGHLAQIADLLSAIEEGRPPLVTGEDARRSLEVVLAVYESSRTNATVTLPLQRPDS
jgi:UDP-N-acetyl-2-amino-2-deoxyglucuronate dehydrogenase